MSTAQMLAFRGGTWPSDPTSDTIPQNPSHGQNASTAAGKWTRGLGGTSEVRRTGEKAYTNRRYELAKENPVTDLADLHATGCGDSIYAVSGNNHGDDMAESPLLISDCQRSDWEPSGWVQEWSQYYDDLTSTTAPAPCVSGEVGLETKEDNRVAVSEANVPADTFLGCNVAGDDGDMNFAHLPLKQHDDQKAHLVQINPSWVEALALGSLPSGIHTWLRKGSTQSVLVKIQIYPSCNTSKTTE